MSAVVTDAMVERAFDVILRTAYVPAWVVREAVTAALTDPRTCGGCGASLADMRADAQWCNRACKIRTDRRVAAEKAAQTARPVVRRPGGLQVAFGPASEALAAEFRRLDVTYPKARAVMVLRRALSRKQRARLDEARRPGLMPDPV